MPSFRIRHVLVKDAPGANTVPSGMDTSLMKRARSHTGDAGTDTVELGLARVGMDKVLVAKAGGRVGVLNGTDCVNWACTVCAAAVKTAFGSSVTGALDGRLHAESINIITDRIKA